MEITIAGTQWNRKDQKIKNFHPTGTCPIRDVLCRLNDRRSMLVLVTLNANGTMRFSDIHKTIDDISQQMLTITPRALKTDELVQRKVYTEMPPQVGYRLMGTGRSLIPHVEALIGWALDHITMILEHREGGRK